jgi:hypothetical protein
MILLKYFMYGILASGILIFIAKVLLYGIAHRDGDYYEKKYGELDRAYLSGISEDGTSVGADSDADKDIRDLSNIPGIVHEDEEGGGEDV